MVKQVIEYAGVPVGITVSEGSRLKFIAVKYPVIDLDGSYYQNITELRVAIREQLAKASPDDQAIFTGAGNASAGGALLRNAFNAA